MIYSLDTSVIVDAMRQREALDRLEAFFDWALVSLELSSVVAAELEAGARTPEQRRLVGALVIERLERRGRVVAPTASAWRRAGRIISELPRRRPDAAAQNDTLLAVQARERGWTLITRDRDFESLRTKIRGLQVAQPFPAAPRR